MMKNSMFIIKNSTVLFLILASLFNVKINTQTEPEILDIDKTVGAIHNQHDCDAKKWHNKQESSCQCCLTYGQGRFGHEKSADEIIRYCIDDSKQCNESLIHTIKKNTNTLNESSQQFLHKLYSDTAVIKKMEFDQSLLGPDGTLTENLLTKVLAQAYKEGKLKHEGFNQADCLKAKSLGSGSGYNTVQLFLVTSTCEPAQDSLYIVKESRKGLEESTNLKKIEDYPGMEELISPRIPKDLPTIALPFFYFSYHPYHKNIHYIAAMPAASGIVLCDLIIEFRENQTKENAERLKRAYWILGKELGNFHKRFMKPVQGKVLGLTVAHGDLHCHNIFYDEEKGHFTFIDNETMVRSFHNLKKPVIDFMRLIFPPFSTNETRYQFKELIMGIKTQTWLNLTLTPFLHGYLSAYSNDQQKQLLQDLREIFTGEIKADPLHFDKKRMTEIKEKYIAPIFDQLEKELSYETKQSKAQKYHIKNMPKARKTEKSL